MTVQILVYLRADTHGKEYFTYLDDERGRREYDALASAFRAFVSSQPEKKIHELTIEAGWEWVVRLDALQAIEFRVFDEAGMQYRIDVEVAMAKRNSRLEKAVKEATSDAVGFR
jgi:hypothetical protein